MLRETLASAQYSKKKIFRKYDKKTRLKNTHKYITNVTEYCVEALLKDGAQDILGVN